MMFRLQLGSILFMVALLSAPVWSADMIEQVAAAHRNDQPVASPAATTAPARAVNGETVIYAQSASGEPVRGYLARPADAAPGTPGLIVIHEWWGLNDNIRQVTERLAAEGYVALAVDLYGGKTGADPKAAMGLMQTLQANAEPANDNLRQAFGYLRDRAGAKRIGVIGWCLGGQWSLRTALLLPDSLDAAVIYYGSVTTDPAQLATLQMPILANFAENDPIIPLDTVAEFRSTLQELGKNADVKVYAGAQHAFANPSGMAYDAAAAEDAWQRTTAFLRSQLQR